MYNGKEEVFSTGGSEPTTKKKKKTRGQGKRRESKEGLTQELSDGGGIGSDYSH